MLFASLTGCATMAGTVRERATVDFQCTPDEVTVTELPGNAYHATGCGRSATYACQSTYSETGLFG